MGVKTVALTVSQEDTAQRLLDTQATALLDQCQRLANRQGKHDSVESQDESGFRSVHYADGQLHFVDILLRVHLHL